MVYQRCSRCSKFSTKKKLVNEHQKANGIDECTLCLSCAKTLYTGFVGLVCSVVGYMTAQQGGKHGNFCFTHSPLECSVVGCTTSPIGGASETFARGILLSSARLSVARLLP